MLLLPSLRVYKHKEYFSMVIQAMEDLLIYMLAGLEKSMTSIVSKNSDFLTSWKQGLFLPDCPIVIKKFSVPFWFLMTPPSLYIPDKLDRSLEGFNSIT